MPKLNKQMQKQTGAAETSAFDPIDPGVYHVRLRDVDGTGSGAKGPYWSWEFEVVEAPYVGRRLWNNTSLSEAAAFKMKETFDAFGVGYDADTDDLLGQIVKAHVSIRTIQSGDRKGQLANQVDRLEPADDDFQAEESAQPQTEDIFS